VATDLPLFPLGAVLLPGHELPLHIFEPRYRRLVEDLLKAAENKPAQFGVIAIRHGHEVGADAALDLHAVGCVAQVNEITAFEDGRYLVESTGLLRFRVRSVRRDEAPYLIASVELLPEPAGAGADELAVSVATGFDGYADALTEVGVQVREPRSLPTDPVALSYAIAGAMVLDRGDRQRLLECDDAARRLAAERILLRRETALIDAFGCVPGDDLLRDTPLSVN
jgi:Lon protease-like protein